MRLVLLSLGLAVVTACSANAEDASSSSAATTESEAITLDCSKIGGFPEAAMNGVGDATFVRSGVAPSNSLVSFSLGPLQAIDGWAGKHATYTRDVAAPCMDVVAIGDGSGLTENRGLPMTSVGCAGQNGIATVMLDNAALGAFIQFDDQTTPFGKDMYFVTGSQLGADGKVVALCLSSVTAGQPFLLTRK